MVLLDAFYVRSTLVERVSVLVLARMISIRPPVVPLSLISRNFHFDTLNQGALNVSGCSGQQCL